MSDKNDGGDKTEKPTPKRLEDARKKGDVSKSKEVSSTVVLVLWLGLGALLLGFASARLAALWEALFAIIGRGWETTGFAGAVRSIGGLALELGVLLVGAFLVPVAATGLLAWTIATFAMVSLLDAAYQRWSFTKKMRMSMRDIKQEMKESEGDPYIKQHRRQAAQEWQQRNSAQAARNANVLVVNPTHVAI